MGDVHEGGAQPPLQLDQLHAHGGAQLGVQVGQRLVHQEHAGLFDHGAGQGDALALAAGKVRGLAVQIGRHAHDLGIFRDAAVPLLLGHLFVFQAKLNVFAHAHGGIDGVILEHHGDIAFFGRLVGDVLAVHQNAAGGGGTDAGDHAQQRGLAAAGGAHQHGKLAVFNGQIQVFDDLGAAKGFANFFKYDLSHAA